MRPERILWLSELYPTREDPGRAAYLWPLLDRLRHRVPLSLALLEEPGLEPDFSGLGGIPPDLPVERIPIPAMRRARRVWVQALLSGGAVRRVRSLAPALVHAQFGAPSGILAARTGLPFGVTFRGTDANVYLDSPVLGMWMRRALRRAAFLTAVSASVAETAARHGLGPALVVENGVDLGRFRPSDRLRARAELGLPPAGPVLLFVGHLLAAKGLEELATALPAVRAAHPTLCTVLLGGGADPAPWRARFAGLGEVRFPGPRPAAEIPRWMAACDLLCLPSHAEGRPNVVLEAVASGRPVVATSVGALPGLVDASNGLLVPPRDAAALSAALLRALGREWSEAGVRARASAWSWDAAADRLAAVYRAAGAP